MIASRLLGLLVVASLALPACATGIARPDPQAIRKGADREATALLRRVNAVGDPRLQEYLAGVVGRLLRDSGGGVTGARIIVLEDPALAAFALPNGHVYILTGLLSRVDDETQLATILARELARSSEIAPPAAMRVPLAPTPLGPTAAAILGHDLQLMAVSAILGLGDGREREADAEAARRLTAAGYDLREAARTFERLATDADGRGALEVFLHGRPARLRERSASFEDLRRAAAGGAASRGGAEAPEFEEVIRPVVRDNAALDVRAGRFGLARRQLDRVLAVTPDDPVAHLHYGELHRLRSQHAGADAERTDGLRAAIAHYRRAVALDPAYAAPFRQLGLLHYQAGDMASALAAFASYLALEPKAPDAPRVREYLTILGAPWGPPRRLGGAAAEP